MPLVSATFQAELVGIFEKGPSGNKSGKKVGIDVSKAYMNYISAGMNAGGFPFLQCQEHLLLDLHWEIFWIKKVHRVH